MQSILTLLTSQPYLNLPVQFLGLTGLFLFLTFLGVGVKLWWENPIPKSNRQWMMLVGLIILVPLATLVFGFRINGLQMLPVPGIPMDMQSPAIMVLAALPWMLAAGWLGPLPALIIGLFSGLLTALWGTHNLFTVLEIGTVAVLFSATIRQRFRTGLYGWLRHPLIAALAIALFNFVVLIISNLFGTYGSIAARLDFSLTQSWMLASARAIEMIIGGSITEGLFLFLPSIWFKPGNLVPSPSESSLAIRFFNGTAPLIIALLLTLVLGDWLVAGKAARTMLQDRLSSTAQVAAESLPYFLETGQNLIMNQATPDLLSMKPDQLQEALSRRIHTIPYFNQLILFDGMGQSIMGFPIREYAQMMPVVEEKRGIEMALKGVSLQTYTIPPSTGGTSAQVTFIASIPGKDGKVGGVLLGRTDLSTNPFTQTVLRAFKTMSDLKGYGLILDEEHRVIYQSGSTAPLEMVPYVGKIPVKASLIEDISPQGTRQYVYYQPVVGRSWSILLTLPAEQAQQVSLNIALPLLVMLAVLMLVAYFFLRLGLGRVTTSLKTLASSATYIAEGQLEHPLEVQGVDEIGQLSRAFEQMRVRLRSRLEELNRLLTVSQGVAANLEGGQAIDGVLQAALIDGATIARMVVFQDSALADGSIPLAHYGKGPAAANAAYLDEQLYELLRHHEVLAIPNTARIHRVSMKPGAHQPAAILALALRHESHFYGVLWIGFNTPCSFNEEQVRFLSMLAGQAALAVANTRLYASAEIGRQRLEAVLNSTPEPVLLFDDQLRLQLLNPAALQVYGLVTAPLAGKRVQEVITQPDLLALITSPTENRSSSREVHFSNGRDYYASVSSVVAEGRLMGVVCILQDITQYKKLDTLKSDFVATVSHDLRSPLTLIRGNTTMLQMVGELNDQQRIYALKIEKSVGDMTSLVNNLLNLAKLEAGLGLEVEEYSTNGLIEEVITSLKPQANQKRIALALESKFLRDVIMRADREQIKVALVNLAENAIKYTSSDGKVIIRLQSQEQTILFEIKDTGIGIAPLDLPHVFEKFYRSGRREAYQQHGTGLGLAIVKSICERHSGTVWVESQLGKGSTFFMQLPIRSEGNPIGEKS